MPTYKDPHNGVSLSEALHEAAVVAPIERAMLQTFEFWHPSFSVPIYAVADYQPFVAVKEATAARDPGRTVSFLAVSITVGSGEESDAGAQEVSITMSNVSGLMSEALRNARGSLDPWEMILREYASDDPSGPAMLPPLSLYVTSASITAEVLTLTCSYGDSANVSVPRLTFRRDQYPGLVR